MYSGSSIYGRLNSAIINSWYIKHSEAFNVKKSNYKLLWQPQNVLCRDRCKPRTTVRDASYFFINVSWPSDDYKCIIYIKKKGLFFTVHNSAIQMTQ